MKRVWKRRQFTAEQRARRREWAREYRQRSDTRERFLAIRRAGARRYYVAHSDEVRQRARAYHQRNRETIRKRRREYYLRNKERLLRAQREFAKAHPDVMSSRRREYYARNRDRILAYVKEYHRTNPEKHRVWEHARRARENAAPGRFTVEEFRSLVQLYGGRCAYCGTVTRLVPDHRIPLKRHELCPTNDIRNILPACAPCNTSKGTKTEQEFREWLARIVTVSRK